MRRYQFLIFFSIVLAFYALINYYIYAHAIKAFEPGAPARPVFTWIFIAVLLLFPLGRILERFWHNRWIYRVSEIGSFWLAAMLYFFLISLLFDLAGLVASIFRVHAVLEGQAFREIAVIASGALVFFLLVGGYINARHPRIKELDLSIRKKAGALQELKIVVASDIHLGSIIGEKRVAGLVRRINKMQPDLVLLAGDILDEDTGPVIHQDLGACLKRIRSRLGVYAITGNHEFIGGINKAIPFLENHGIKVLKDSWTELEDHVILAGRLDRDMQRYLGQKGKPLEAVLSGADLSKPVIVMDHQPLRLEESARLGVDLHLSGHTHHGQIWPLQFFTSRLFRISWGHRIVDHTHFYVSSGFGTWGPPVRIGNRPEIVLIRLRFEANDT
jgi:predicted MPP superfamily phosphohydrolase